MGNPASASMTYPAKGSECLLDLVTWKEPVSSGAVFLAVTLYAVLSALVAYPLQWIFFIIVWVGFSVGLVAKYLFKARNVQWFNAQKVSSIFVTEMRALRGAVSKVISWEDPELSLTVVLAMFMASVAVSYFGVPGTLSLAMIVPLLWRNLIQPSNHAIVDALSLLMRQYVDMMYQYLPDLKAAFNWEDPKASAAALLSINGIICIVPMIASDCGISTLIKIIAYSTMASFVVKEVADSQISCGSCAVDVSAVEEVFEKLEKVVVKVQAKLLWQDVNESAWAFAACIGVMGSIHIFGSLPVALMIVNGLSISYHPEVSMRIKQE